MPKHLRYDPSLTDDEWLLRSTLLYCKYYHCQTLVHLPFSASSRMSPSFKLPSLSITTIAAKSTFYTLQKFHKRQLIGRGGRFAACRIFEAGCVLLVIKSELERKCPAYSENDGWGHQGMGRYPADRSARSDGHSLVSSERCSQCLTMLSTQYEPSRS